MLDEVIAGALDAQPQHARLFLSIYIRDDEDDDPDKTIRKVSALRQHDTPADALAAQQWHAEVAKRLQAVLTKQEHYVYTMLFVEDMPVKDIAAALGVTPRTINTYKNTAIDKVAEMRKEFMQ